MRVLVLATDVFGGTGGIAQYTRDFVTALAKYPATKNVTVIPRVIARDPEPLPQGVTYLSNAAGSKARFVATVLKTALRTHFDWIVCAHINLLPIAHAAAAITRSRVILLTYGIEVWEKRGWLTRNLLARNRAAVSISSITMERMAAWAPKSEWFLIPNAIDLDKYKPGSPPDDLVSRWSLQGRRVLLTLGRMEAREQAKGFDEVLDVMPRLNGEFSDVVYIAVGDGSDRARLEQKAAWLGVSERSIFPGYVSETEKLDYYRLANVFVMPSRLEGFGYVFLEALAMERPVIASKVDGSREAVRGGEWGLLVDPGKPDELLAAVRSALVSPKLPERCELERFSVESFEQRCHEMFEKLLAGH